MSNPQHSRDSPDGTGESGSSAELLPQVYDELRRLARMRIAQEPAGLTLQPTALVHEAYLRLAGDGTDRRWDRRGHFFAAAAIAMRRILVERARPTAGSNMAARSSGSSWIPSRRRWRRSRRTSSPSIRH